MSVYPAALPTVRPAVRSAFEQGSGGGAASIIAGLFSAGQQGFWLPFTDFDSLSQDSAGTLPYTALEQPVGRVLDRSGRGNHASQVTSTARGIVSARVNRLTNTDNPAAWEYQGSRYSSGAKQPDGGWPLTALTTNQQLAAVNTSYPIGSTTINQDGTLVRCIDVKAGTATHVYLGGGFSIGAVIRLSDSVVEYIAAGLTVSVEAVDSGFTRITLRLSGSTFSASVLGNFLSWGLGKTSGAINATGQIGTSIIVRNPDYAMLALGYTGTMRHQRVNTPTDYDSVGFPKYARLDGTDDFYTCGGGGSTTGFYYSDVVRPIGGAGTRRVIFSDRSGNNGYELAINAADKLEFGAGNGAAITTLASANVTPLTVGLPFEVVDDLTNLIIKIDGQAAVTIPRPAVAAGSSTITLYRGASTGYFNGNITEPIYRAGPPPSTYERSVIRGYQMQKAGL